MALFFYFLLFTIFSVLVFYIPGKFLLSKLNIKLQGLESVVIASVVGTLFFVLLEILFRTFGVSPLVIFSLDLVLCIFYLRSVDDFRAWNLNKLYKNLNFWNIQLCLILILGVISQVWIHFASGILSKEGLSFLYQPFRDASFHLSIIEELKHGFPPQNPFYAGVPLKNYHYFTDFLISGINSILPIPLFDLYFKILPFFVSIFYGLSVYIITSKLTDKLMIKNLSVFLAYFAGPFTYLIPLFRPGPWTAFSYMLNQPFDSSFNIQWLFSIVIFLTGLYFIFEYQKKGNKRSIYLAGFIYAFCAGFKVHVAILGLGGLLVLSFYTLIFKKSYFFFKVFFITLIIFIFFSLLIVDTFQSSLHLAPGWTLRKMVEDPDRLNLQNFVLLEQHYASFNNYFRLAEIYLKEFLIYTFGNLGVRILGFFYFIILLKNIKKLSPAVVFIMSASIGSLFIPIIFNQGSSPYNIVQFGVYSLTILSIFTAIFIEKLTDRLRIFRNYFVTFCLIISIMLLSIPANIKTFVTYLNYQKFVLSLDEVNTLKYLGEYSNKKSVVLVYPSFDNANTAYVSAISGRRVYLSTMDFVKTMSHLDYDLREKKVMDFFYTLNYEEQREFLKIEGINYIYLSRDDLSKIESSGRDLRFPEIVNTNKDVLYELL